jgi:hypothetical protein
MEPAPDVADALRRYLGALAANDRDTISAMISRNPGVVAIGSDPSEVWRSGHEWATSLVGLLDQVGGLPVTPSDPQGYVEGSVGWAWDLPVIRVPGRDDLSFRMAAVFHREGSDWKLVMLHASLGVDVQQLSQRS